MRDFKGHTQHVTQLKKDLESVFKRIRVLKVKVASQHPEAFNAIEPKDDQPKREEDDEYDVAIKERRKKQEEEASAIANSAKSSGKISPIIEDS